MLEGPHIDLANLVTFHPDAVGTLVSENDPSALPDNLTLALWHRIQPLAAVVRVELSPHPFHVAPSSISKEPYEGWVAGCNFMSCNTEQFILELSLAKIT